MTVSLVADVRGTATLPVGIPADPSLAGIGMATQAVMVGVPGTPFGFAANHALDVQIDAR